jgi:hypothetical protein
MLERSCGFADISGGCKNATQENEALTRGDGTGRQMVADSRGHSQHYYCFGEEGNARHDAFAECCDAYGDAIMVPRRDSHVQVSVQNGGCEIIGHPHQRLYQPTGSPESIRPIQSMVVETTMPSPTRSRRACSSAI